MLIGLNHSLLAAELFDPALQPIASIGSLAISYSDLQSNQSTVYPFTFDPTNWSGDMSAKAINNLAQVQATGPWGLSTVASRLNLLNYDTARKIVTRNGSHSIPFRWTELSATQQASLGDDISGPKRVDYIRGDRSAEGYAPEAYRVRTSVLGDIIHTNITYWQQDKAHPYLYVGANDGLLHVFNALTAEEIYAYIPSMLIANLKRLANKPYVHSYFVDGNMSIANVSYQNSDKSILVGGLGAGGKGFYSLDVTNANAEDEYSATQHIKWEITPDTIGFADLGYTYGRPKIGRLNDGTAVVIAGNGYINSGSGHAILYVINLESGGLIKAIDTGSGNSQSPNGLSSPTLFDANGDGKVDYVYAGDLDGQVWKFNLSSLSSLDFSVGAYGSLFTTSPLQAITTAPVITAHPSGVGQLVVFATGRVLSEDDIDVSAVHYVYGVWDGAPAGSAALLEQSLVGSGSSTWRTVTAYQPQWDATGVQHRAWRLALPMGEQVIGDNPFKENGRFYFVSTLATFDAKGTSNFSHWFYELDINTGGSPDHPIFDSNGDGLLTDLDRFTSCTVTVTAPCIPVAKYLGAGFYSQPTYLQTTTLNSVLFSHLELQSGSQLIKIIEPTIPVGLSIKSVITTNFGHIKATTTTYSDLSIYVVNTITQDDGSITVQQVFRDGSEKVTELTTLPETVISPVTAPKQENVTDKMGRIAWREIFNQ